MKPLIILAVILAAFSCGNRPGKASVFLQGTFTRPELRADGFSPVGLPGSLSQGPGFIDNWLIKDINDTTVSYIFYDSVLLMQQIQFSPAKTDSISLFNFLRQLGFKSNGDTLTFRDIILEVKRDSAYIKFTRKFPISENAQKILDRVFIKKGK
jgi:hypothetical protein